MPLPEPNSSDIESKNAPKEYATPKQVKHDRNAAPTTPQRRRLLRSPGSSDIFPTFEAPIDLVSSQQTSAAVPVSEHEVLST